MKHVINTRCISQIRIYDKEWASCWNYLSIKKSWHTKAFEGFYYLDPLLEIRMSMDKVKSEGFLMENNNLYSRPYVVIKMTDGESICKRFDTFQEAKEYGEKMEQQIEPYKLTL